MIIAILIIQIITLVFGILPMAAFWVYVIYDARKDKRAAQIAAALKNAKRSNSGNNSADD